MNVVILGCGRVGGLLATLMSQQGHEVAIIDVNKDSFRRLGPGFRGRKVLGKGIDEDTLRSAGLPQADAFVAVTNGDNTNLMASQIAQHRFNVPRVITRVADPIRAQAYREMGLDTMCSSLMGAGIIRSVLLGESPVDALRAYSDLLQELK